MVFSDLRLLCMPDMRREHRSGPFCRMSGNDLRRLLHINTTVTGPLAMEHTYQQMVACTLRGTGYAVAVVATTFFKVDRSDALFCTAFSDTCRAF